MKFYIDFTSKRREQKNRIISGLVIAASMSIAAVIVTTIGAIIVLKSAGMLNIVKDESDAAVDTVKRKANHIIKDISDKNRIFSRGIKTGFQQITRDINKTVEKVSEDLK